ncbi:hypothetical protein ACFXKI_37480 [Streptomyces mirabilis]|uniref:hypothetical protein n=1 Tax=Streptomyces mirabilis TaxID=68239 RepID=UPI0036AA98D3
MPERSTRLPSGPWGEEPSGRMPEALGDQLIGQLVDRAKAGGLTGEGGLLHLTKRLLVQGR